MLGLNTVVPSIAHAGFTPEELAAFEITEMRATVTTALPEEKVIEVIDPHGHKEILTVGIDLTPSSCNRTTTLSSRSSMDWSSRWSPAQALN